jgi:hypothetical protein
MIGRAGRCASSPGAHRGGILPDGRPATFPPDPALAPDDDHAPPDASLVEPVDDAQSAAADSPPGERRSWLAGFLLGILGWIALGALLLAGVLLAVGAPPRAILLLGLDVSRVTSGSTSQATGRSA